ncbi:MAG: hypothetical protein CL583_07400 [Alteromonadaceae bacterium]|nr:hypothetical protein [Alteromonadaceae bacterium]|tara:strand:- start:1922 stop:2314 length:393 start_codon:yes stop_codon:yes gene_type:complete
MAFNANRNDVTKFTAGTWVSMLGAEFKIARAGNPEYEKALEASGYRKKEEPGEKLRALYSAVASGILRDWKDVVDAEGKEIPFSVENATEVLLDNPDLASRVLSEANDLQNFRRQDASQQAKKPKTTSDS